MRLATSNPVTKAASIASSAAPISSPNASVAAQTGALVCVTARDIGVVEIEAMRERAVGERGDRGGGGVPNSIVARARLPQPDSDFAHDAPRRLVAGADRHAEPIRQAQTRQVGDLGRQRPLPDLGDIGGERRAVAPAAFGHHVPPTRHRA